MLKSTLPLFFALVATATGLGEPLALTGAVSPDRKRELVVTHTQNRESREAVPQVTLRDSKSRKALHSVPIDIDESDYRKSIGALWSPNSRYVAVNEHSGQLWYFKVYDVSGDTLRALTELPIPKKFVNEFFTPESTKTRGGQQVQRWLDEVTFVVEDTMYYVDITYRVTKQKLEVVNVKQQPQ